MRFKPEALKAACQLLQRFEMSAWVAPPSAWMRLAASSLSIPTSRLKPSTMQSMGTPQPSAYAD